MEGGKGYEGVFTKRDGRLLVPLLLCSVLTSVPSFCPLLASRALHAQIRGNL